jgi:hypothetical protein
MTQPTGNSLATLTVAGDLGAVVVGAALLVGGGLGAVVGGAVRDAVVDDGLAVAVASDELAVVVVGGGLAVVVDGIVGATAEPTPVVGRVVTAAGGAAMVERSGI